ncbi:MAG: metal ABC transporter ATP-binding protein [Peptoniphilaceae bacterium]
MGNPILKISNLSFGYGKDDIFKNINLEINRGDFVALIGPNGAGKSTLIKLILNQLKARSGNIDLYLDDENSYKLVGYVPQLGIGSSYNFPITVRELVSLPIYKNKRGFKKFKENLNVKVSNALAQVNMEDYEDYLYSQLSGGQRQRVLISKALVSNPEFLILDEPTNGIDYETRLSLFNLLSHINKVHNITILMITHELSNIEDHINKLYKLNDGKLERCK